MKRFSTNDAAKLLGTTATSLVRYMKAGKIPLPQVVQTGRASLHLWTQADIEHARKLLPKIANGRKTRYLKSKKSKDSSQKTVKAKSKKSHSRTRPCNRKRSNGQRPVLLTPSEP
jgi:hypothetical protein